MMSYDETMRWGEAQYADVLQELQAAGFPAVFTQTGGMCAAIEVPLEAGHRLLITDADRLGRSRRRDPQANPPSDRATHHDQPGRARQRSRLRSRQREHRRGVTSYDQALAIGAAYLGEWRTVTGLLQDEHDWLVLYVVGQPDWPQPVGGEWVFVSKHDGAIRCEAPGDGAAQASRMTKAKRSPQT
jgi:hypothetical protein